VGLHGNQHQEVDPGHAGHARRRLTGRGTPMQLRTKKGQAPCGLGAGPFFNSPKDGRYWTRTSDFYRVKDRLCIAEKLRNHFTYRVYIIFGRFATLRIQSRF
jgi:hypothetical protein